jgi:copper chaperone CopZ
MKYLLQLKIGGIHCAGCFNQIDHAIRILGADRFYFDFETMIETIEYTGDFLRADRYVTAIVAAGFRARILSNILQVDEET